MSISSGGADEAIITTDEHPFHIIGKGFVPAAQLKVSDVVRLAGDKTASVVGVKRNNIGQLAYNLTVSNDHTYFVGRKNVWVHNVCNVTYIAKEGGTHAGQLRQFLSWTPKQLQKSIKSFDKLIADHQSWIADPTSKIPNFNSFSAEHQKNILHHWSEDAKRAQDLKDIAQDVLDEF